MRTILVILVFCTLYLQSKSQSVYIIYSRFDMISDSWKDSKGIMYLGKDSMYISTKEEFIKIRFLGNIEGHVSNTDPKSENLVYRQEVTLTDYKIITDCYFETIIDKKTFEGLFSFYTFDKTTNKVIKRYFTYWVIPIKF